MEDADWLFELASILGERVGELVETMPAQELLMWNRWLQSKPRGDKRGDWHAAMTAKAIHDIALGFSGKQNPSALDAYLPEWKLVTPESAARQIKLAARSIFGSIVPLPKGMVTL